MRSEPRNFVVQIDPEGSDAAGKGATPLVGRVETLDSGEWTRFRSARALLRFIRHALAEPASTTPDRRDKT